MKLFTQGPLRNGQNELNAEWAGEPGCEGVARHDWSKQSQTLLELREEVLKQIHDLAEEAREENPTDSLHMADAATDTIELTFSSAWYHSSTNRSTKSMRLWNESRRARMASAN